MGEPRGTGASKARAHPPGRAEGTGGGSRDGLGSGTGWPPVLCQRPHLHVSHASPRRRLGPLREIPGVMVFAVLVSPVFVSWRGADEGAGAVSWACGSSGRSCPSVPRRRAPAAWFSWREGRGRGSVAPWLAGFPPGRGAAPPASVPAVPRVCRTLSERRAGGGAARPGTRGKRTAGWNRRVRGDGPAGQRERRGPSSRCPGPAQQQQSSPHLTRGDVGFYSVLFTV